MNLVISEFLIGYFMSSGSELELMNISKQFIIINY